MQKSKRKPITLKDFNAKSRKKEWFVRLHQVGYGYDRKKAERAVSSYINKSTAIRQKLRDSLFRQLEIVYRKKTEREKIIIPTEEQEYERKDEKRFSKRFKTFESWKRHAQENLTIKTLNRVERYISKNPDATLTEAYRGKRLEDKSTWFSPKYKTFSQWKREALEKVYQGKMKESYYNRIVSYVSKQVDKERIKLKYARGKK